ncbi:class I SAM-dependent methyltransferase [Streptomyces sp. NBC_00513]|uniref:class I SAM-dependent methyltransferase n=1 Tax=unclassified Streptomyces TaxID=2593676 RepID=UPI00225699E8|nr:class I SAM-dependent methyltransferase [Streptomyces sp. NBC_00424]MCX5071089.1 class I SAM-dependent methyltransferase [Streptomyces sp. NBC_00424]WUD45487.1 class I SAM-dependent methyltransferase [Streptomyces sp. NBC_00513]
MSVKQEYANLSPLQTRIKIHSEYSERQDDVEEAVYHVIRPSLSDSLLDVGCGTGSFLKRLRAWGVGGELVALDSSDAAVSAVAALGVADAVCADATRLPFSDGWFGILTARHMLYHVEEPDTALHEFARVLRPGGRVAVSVNHARTVPLTTELVFAAMEEAGAHPVSSAAHVSSDDLAHRMTAVFHDVQSERFDNALVFDQPAPLIAFARALLGIYGLHPDDERHSEAAAGIGRRAERWFADHQGPLRDPKGYTICHGRA